MKIKEGDIFQHFKGVTIKALFVAKHTETLEDLVIYEHDNCIWARPVSMFLDRTDVSKREDNVTGQKYRFELIKEGR